VAGMVGIGAVWSASVPCGDGEIHLGTASGTEGRETTEADHTRQGERKDACAGESGVHHAYGLPSTGESKD